MCGAFILVTAQLPGANGYSGGKVIFIDTEVGSQICIDMCLQFIAGWIQRELVRGRGCSASTYDHMSSTLVE